MTRLILPLAAWWVCAPAAGGAPIRAPVEAAGERLVDAQQCRKWSWGGYWPHEETHTGIIVAGLAEAYALVGDEGFKTAAREGAEYIRHQSDDNFFGDEAYALSCLAGSSSTDPGEKCETSLKSFYAKVQRSSGGTRGCITMLSEQNGLSETVFYLACFTVAAFSVDASDKSIWREGLTERLAQVDDSTADYPVRTLGVALWALATTGALDDSAVDPCAAGLTYWHGKTLAELPDLLLEHWIGEGDMAGSFYKRFDHGNGGVGPIAGYTEDTVCGALGLAAARYVFDNRDIDPVLERIREVLLACIDETTGEVREHLWLASDDCYLYAGEVLQAIAALTNPADLDLQGRVDAADLALLGAYWRCRCRPDQCSCKRADINHDGQVDEKDLMEMARRWLRP